MKQIKEHLQAQAKFANERAERAESAGRKAAKESVEFFNRAEIERSHAAEFQRLADAQPE
jgi:hypothetical protein